MTTAVIVGAGPGLGRSLALAFAEPGGAITLIARHADRLAPVVEELRAGGTRAEARGADVRYKPILGSVLIAAMDRFGPPDVLVYNAAVIRTDRIGQLSSAEYEQAWGVDVVGAVTAVSVVAPRMGRRGAGTIILTGGMPTPDPDHVSLSLGKAGLRAFTEIAAGQYGPDGVHVATVIIGGPIEPGTDLDPGHIAAHYRRLHAQPRERWQREVLLPDLAVAS